VALVEQRLAELGITLPDTATPLANYVLARVSGHHLYVSGHVGKRDGAVVSGKVGDDVDRDTAYQLARATAIDILASVRAALGSLDQVRGVIKVTGFVNGGASFIEHPAVVNGASDLFVEVFGPDAGRHARSAVGVAQLPLGAAVEIETIFEIE